MVCNLRYHQRGSHQSWASSQAREKIWSETYRFTSGFSACHCHHFPQTFWHGCWDGRRPALNISKANIVLVYVLIDKEAFPLLGESSITAVCVCFFFFFSDRELEELTKKDAQKEPVILPVKILPENASVAMGKGGRRATMTMKQEVSINLLAPSVRRPLRHADRRSRQNRIPLLSLNIT